MSEENLSYNELSDQLRNVLKENKSSGKQELKSAAISLLLHCSRIQALERENRGSKVIEIYKLKVTVIFQMILSEFQVVSTEGKSKSKEMLQFQEDIQNLKDKFIEIRNKIADQALNINDEIRIFNEITEEVESTIDEQIKSPMTAYEEFRYFIADILSSIVDILCELKNQNEEQDNQNISSSNEEICKSLSLSRESLIIEDAKAELPKYIRSRRSSSSTSISISNDETPSCKPLSNESSSSSTSKSSTQSNQTSNRSSTNISISNDSTSNTSISRRSPSSELSSRPSSYRLSSSKGPSSSVSATKQSSSKGSSSRGSSSRGSSSRGSSSKESSSRGSSSSTSSTSGSSSRGSSSRGSSYRGSSSSDSSSITSSSKGSSSRGPSSRGSSSKESSSRGSSSRGPSSSTSSSSTSSSRGSSTSGSSSRGSSSRGSSSRGSSSSGSKSSGSLSSESSSTRGSSSKGPSSNTSSSRGLSSRGSSSRGSSSRGSSSSGSKSSGSLSSESSSTRGSSSSGSLSSCASSSTSTSNTLTSKRPSQNSQPSKITSSSSSKKLSSKKSSRSSTRNSIQISSTNCTSKPIEKSTHSSNKISNNSRPDNSTQKYSSTSMGPSQISESKLSTSSTIQSSYFPGLTSIQTGNQRTVYENDQTIPKSVNRSIKFRSQISRQPSNNIQRYNIDDISNLDIKQGRKYSFENPSTSLNQSIFKSSKYISKSSKIQEIPKPQVFAMNPNSSKARLSSSSSTAISKPIAPQANSCYPTHLAPKFVTGKPRENYINNVFGSQLDYQYYGKPTYGDKGYQISKSDYQHMACHNIRNHGPSGRCNPGPNNNDIHATMRFSNQPKITCSDKTKTQFNPISSVHYNQDRLHRPIHETNLCNKTCPPPISRPTAHNQLHKDPAGFSCYKPKSSPSCNKVIGGGRGYHATVVVPTGCFPTGNRYQEHNKLHTTGRIASLKCPDYAWDLNKRYNRKMFGCAPTCYNIEGKLKSDNKVSESSHFNSRQ